jgi:hypothetical protein
VRTYKNIQDGAVQKAFFLSAPPGGHQVRLTVAHSSITLQQILVPIELRQVKQLPDQQNIKMVSIGVQTDQS